MNTFKVLDTVATLNPIPRSRLILVDADDASIQHLPIGQVGTIVEVYEADRPKYLVEFADLQGHEYAMAALDTDELLALHYELASSIA